MNTTVNTTNIVSLLETTLQTYGVEKYLPCFKKYGIDSKILPLLNDEDLKIIGIEDGDIRNQIIQQCKNLPKRKEIFKYEMDEEYVISSLKDIDQHLKLLHAYLSICVSRKKILLSDVKLKKSINCLSYCAQTFNNEFKKFQNTVIPSRLNNNNKWKYIAGFLAVGTSTMYIYFKYICRYK